MYCGSPRTPKRAQAMKRCMTVLDGYLDFAQDEKGKPLTYQRVVLVMKSAADDRKAAMDTDPVCTAETGSAPPMHSSLNPDKRPTAAPCTRARLGWLEELAVR